MAGDEPGKSGLIKKLEKVSRPEFPYFGFYVFALRFVRAVAAARVDVYFPVNAAARDRRDSGDEPCHDGRGTVGAGNASRNAADGHAAYAIGRRRIGQPCGFGNVGEHRVGDIEEEWRCHRASLECVVSLPVEVADPDAQDVAVENGDAPAVLETDRGAGLEGYRNSFGRFRPDIRGLVVFLEHLARDEGRLAREHALAGRCRRACASGFRNERLHDSGVRDNSVESGKLHHRNFGAAEDDRKAVMLAAPEPVYAGVFQEFVEVGFCDVAGERDRRDVAAVDEGLRRVDRSREIAPEIVGRVFVETDRSVLEHGFGMDEPLLDRERVDKRLERRAGGALRDGSIHLPLYRVVLVIRRTDGGAYFHCGIVDKEYCAVRDPERAVLLDVAFEGAFAQFLEPAVDRCAVLAAVLTEGFKMLGEMRRLERESADHIHAEIYLRFFVRIGRMLRDPAREKFRPGIEQFAGYGDCGRRA